jgi:hypothetical protein
MKTYGGMDVLLRHSLPRRYMEENGQLHDPAALSLWKDPFTLLGRALQPFWTLCNR